MDPVTGTQAFQMKLKPGFSFLDILNHGASLDADIWRGVVQNYGGMDILLSPENPVEGAQEMGDSRPILEFSRRLYDHVVADMGNAYGEWALSALLGRSVSRHHERAARTAGRTAGDGLLRKQWNPPAANSPGDQPLQSRCRPYQGHDRNSAAKRHLSVINSDYEGVQRALLDGKPIQTSTSIGKQIAAMADRILGRRCGKAEEKAEKSRSSGAGSGLFGLFSRST